MTPLSNCQKADIAIAAREAFDAWPEREAFEAINAEFSASARFEAWRHDEQVKACGLRSLRAATQAHYGRLMAHFQALAGHAAAAARTRARDADNDRRIARWKLDQALRERDLQIGYAAEICRDKFKVPLGEATKEHLWKLVFDIRGRRRPAPKVKAPAADDGNPF